MEKYYVFENGIKDSYQMRGYGSIISFVQAILDQSVIAISVRYANVNSFDDHPDGTKTPATFDKFNEILFERYDEWNWTVKVMEEGDYPFAMELLEKGVDDPVICQKEVVDWFALFNLSELNWDTSDDPVYDFSWFISRKLKEE